MPNSLNSVQAYSELAIGAKSQQAFLVRRGDAVQLIEYSNFIAMIVLVALYALTPNTELIFKDRTIKQLLKTKEDEALVALKEIRLEFTEVMHDPIRKAEWIQRYFAQQKHLLPINQRIEACISRAGLNVPEYLNIYVQYHSFTKTVIASMAQDIHAISSNRRSATSIARQSEILQTVAPLTIYKIVVDEFSEDNLLLLKMELRECNPALPFLINVKEYLKANVSALEAQLTTAAQETFEAQTNIEDVVGAYLVRRQIVAWMGDRPSELFTLVKELATKMDKIEFAARDLEETKKLLIQRESAFKKQLNFAKARLSKEHAKMGSVAQGKTEAETVYKGAVNNYGDFKCESMAVFAKHESILTTLFTQDDFEGEFLVSAEFKSKAEEFLRSKQVRLEQLKSPAATLEKLGQAIPKAEASIQAKYAEEKESFDPEILSQKLRAVGAQPENIENETDLDQFVQESIKKQEFALGLIGSWFMPQAQIDQDKQQHTDLLQQLPTLKRMISYRNKAQRLAVAKQNLEKAKTSLLANSVELVTIQDEVSALKVMVERQKQAFVLLSKVQETQSKLRTANAKLDNVTRVVRNHELEVAEKNHKLTLVQNLIKESYGKN